jgi:hypothetical protein
VNPKTPDGQSGTEMIVSFMGLVGVSGHAPRYSEFVLDRIRHRDTAMWYFFSIYLRIAPFPCFSGRGANIGFRSHMNAMVMISLRSCLTS